MTRNRHVFPTPNSLRAVLHLFVVAGCLLNATNLAQAQQTLSAGGRQVPVNQTTPPGVIANLAIAAGKVQPDRFQSVRIKLPSEGQVTFYDSNPGRPIKMAAPAQAGLLIGPVYRLRITGVPEVEHGEFYPTIELIDQLHPPPGQEERFPVEIELLAEELRWADQGRMVTKVVYLEQPDRVLKQQLQEGPRVIDLLPARNALAEADVLGRPIAIVRMGGRVPDANYPDPTFWGSGAPVQLTAAMANGRTGFDARRNRAIPRIGNNAAR